MSENKLHIAQVAPVKGSTSRREPGRREEIQATMERLWREDPQQFNPERDSIQRQRVDRTLELIRKCGNWKGKKGVDLGCGSGIVTSKVRDLGFATVDAIDISSQALTYIREWGVEEIHPIQDCLPCTRLNDAQYDLIICTEVVGYLNPKEYRLLFAELARLVKRDGIVICSSSLDSRTENPLELFSQLADTEFEPLEWVLSYHRWLLAICKVFRKTPLSRFFRQNSKVRDLLETVCRFFSGPSGASHVIFAGKRRPLGFPLPQNELPKEPKQKRRVWE